MNRRRFLAWLGGTAAGAAIAPTLDLERLLWVPGAKTIFVPSARLVDPYTGISIRFIRQWSIERTYSQRLDYFYGAPPLVIPAVLRPELRFRSGA